jgi:hypothetical protein
VELLSGMEPFDRSPKQWCALNAPAWVWNMDTAAEAYVSWALPAYGGGHHPTGQGIRKYYVGMLWWPRCVRPQFLASVGALLPVEAQLLSGDRQARWGRPGRCSSRMLASDASGIPGWLECCRTPRQSGRG